MAKESDKSKTSKTARVMGLLSKKQETPPPEDLAAAPVQPAAAPVPPIITSLAPDAAVSVQIKSALEEALEDELKTAPPPSAPEAEPPAPAPEPIPEPKAEPAPQPPVPSAPAELQPESVSSASAAVSVQPPVVQEPAEKHMSYINVMQVLVEEKAPKYAKMFGLCTCERCLEDVAALALNHLPPKYVVMSENERIPKLTFYEGQYSSDITAQLLNACKVVMQTPHHTRSE